MTPQELKHSMLDLAIRGKLVPQIASEGSASDLYAKIKMSEKEEGIKKSRGKGITFIRSVPEQDYPFDVPNTWKWVRLGTLGYTNIGLTYSPKDISANGTIVLRSSNIQNGKMNYEDTVAVQMEVPENKMCHIGDILICARNGSKRLVGKAAIIDREGMSFGAFMAIFRSCCNEYIFQVFNSAYFRNSLLGDTGTTTINQITQDMLKNVLIPLPPLAEQKRIVDKIEELQPYIDRYEQAWSKLEDFNKRFPADMQKSILQMAIQGKLVEQRPEEGTGEELYQQIQAEKQKLIKAGKIKKEKPLPEIAEDEVPFDIPETWKWVRLSSVGITQTGNTPSKAHPEYIGNDIPFITPGDILNSQISYDNQALSCLGKSVARVCDKGSILQVCIGGSIGKAAITDREITFNQQINAITPVLCCSEYLFAVMQSHMFIGIMRERAGGTATPIINRGLWDSLLIPFPPLAEQKRIVARLEELLPLCDRLK